MSKVRVAIAGVGNCANSFVQGLEYYASAKEDESIPGLMHSVLGGYRIKDIEVVAAFDVVKGKVGKPLSEAMWAHPNDTIRFASSFRMPDVVVQRGMLHDGIGKYLSEIVEIDESEAVDVAQVLTDTKTDVFVIYLPVGSEEAVKWYIEQALVAKVAVVNCLPVFNSREKYWQ